MNFSIKNNHNFGFTLVEILVYIAIFILITTSAIGLLFSLSDLFTQYKLKQSLLESGTNIMERLFVEIREADSIVLTESEIASSTAGALALDKGTETIKFIKVGNNLESSKDNVFLGNLNNSNVSILGATFYYYEHNGVELIRVKLDLRSTLGLQTEEWSVNGGAIIRSSYENN